MSNYCDTETCEICQTETVEGNDELGRCIHCSHLSRQAQSLEHLLSLMAAGVTRDARTGRFASVRKG
jgi:hypothetical protein